MLGCDGLFYYPNRHCYGRPEAPLSFEEVSFASTQGARLHGWFFPASRLARGTVLHLHGNAGNLTGHFQHVSWLPEAGWNVLTFDYRGYGRSSGHMGRAGSIADAHAALDYLLARPDAVGRPVVAFGQSLGGAIGVVVTAQRPEIAALAVDGAFDSYRRIASWHIRRNPVLLVSAWWLPGLLMSDQYNPIDYVSRVAPRPLLIMHGEADQVVDPAMARRLYNAAGEPRQLWMVPDADHYGALQDRPEEVKARLLSFFQAAPAAKAS